MTHVTVETKKEEKHIIDLDGVLKELGSFGKFQLFNFFLICIPITYNGISTLSYVFTAGIPKYRCTIPECESSNISSTEWLSYSTPFRYDNTPEHCSRYAPIKSSGIINCVAETFNKSNVIGCHNFTFETEEVTVANEFDIMCDSNKWKLTLAGTINNIGELFSQPLSGYVSDIYGRKTALVIGMLFGGLFGILRAFSLNYYMFLTFEFLDPFFCAGTYGVAFILGMEYLNPKDRIFGGVIISAFFAVGGVILGATAFFFQNWRHLLLILYLPLLLTISYIWILPESLRWLLTHSRTNKVVKIIKKVAKMNKIELSEKTLASLESATKQSEKEDQEAKEQGTQNASSKGNNYPVLAALKSKKLLIRVANCSFCWLTNSFVYFGLNLNAVTLKGNKYYNFAFSNFIEIPAHLLALLLVNKLGRKWSMCGSLILAGLSCIAFEFLHHDDVQLKFILYMVGKFAISISFTIVYVYTTELFPTSVRNSLLGICSMFGRLGSILAPQSPLLATVYPPLPLFLFGGTSILAGIFSLSFPETVNSKLPDTIEEAIKIGEEVELTKL